MLKDVSTAKKRYKLTFFESEHNESYIKYTNISDVDMALFRLSLEGFGSYNELANMDGAIVADMLEYMSIKNAIERHEQEKARNGRSN
jgi:hypothetical protein